MWRSYLTLGLRALAQNRAYAFITIGGLSLGLAACIMILLYVRYESSYDAWMKDSDRAFQVQAFYEATKGGGQELALQMSSIAVGRALQKDYPQQVEKLVWVRGFSPIVIQDGQAGEIKDLRMVDGDLFEILRLPFVRGSARSALPDTNSIALSESEARRRFGDADPIGKTLTIVDNTGNVDYRVTGVFRDIPRNSHFSAGAIARFDLPRQFADRPEQLTSWTSEQGWNYVRLRSAEDARLIQANMPAWEKRNIPNETVGDQVVNPGSYQNYRVTNVRDVHLGDAQQAAITPGNDRVTVATFAVIGLLVLGMACVNFTNLATARASQRAREVALRKVLGASRRQLIVQFLGESLIVAAMAMILALAAVELLLPTFNTFLGADIDLRYVGKGGILVPLLVLLMLVGLAGGLYPAFYLARFEPARILKANKSAADAQGSGKLRNILVVAQFAVSIGLIICTGVIYSQTLYARSVDAGYRRDGLLQVGNLGYRGVEGRDRQVTEQVRRIPGVEFAARSQIAVNPGGSSTTNVFATNGSSAVEIGNYAIEPGFFAAMGIKLVEGRDLSETQGRDDLTIPWPSTADEQAAQYRIFAQRGANVVLSEEATRRLGFRVPQDAIGAQLRASMLPAEYGLLPVTVVGVVRDARFRSIREPLQPILYYMQRQGFGSILVRFNGDPRAIQSQVEAVWKRNIPQVPFEGRFVDDIARELYDRDEARGQLFASFSLLAVVIGCMGLYGLAAFTAERRTKEIGIRKVLGARTRDIVRLLVWQFTRPVIIANLIAWPIAWWLMRDWLNGFDQRIALTPLPFFIAGTAALLIAVATVGSHAFRVARTNPVHALKYE